MKRPVIVATPEGAAALRARFGEDCDLVPARDPKEVLECLERLARERAAVLLVHLDPSSGSTETTVADAARLAPRAAIAFTHEPPPTGTAPERIVVPPEGEGLASLAFLLLERFRLEERTAENERQLELVSSAGVAMAGSFDILAILKETRAAAREVLDGSDVYIYYAGCPAISARPCWYPEVEEAQLPADIRERLERRVDESVGWRPIRGPLALPIAHQGACLGAMVFHPGSQLCEERRRLLEILALQAATALGNIHSAQERIQFERLSAIGRMIGSIVHDLRSPLTALRGYAGMLHTLDLEDAERREFASAQLDECARLDRMVEELLDFSRGRGPALDRRRTQLRRYLDEIANRARRHYGDAVEIEIEADAHDVVEVLVDRQRLERALWNVVANACQAMASGGGRLAIRTSKVGDRVALDIEDEGEGIPEEIRHRIFEPFFSYGKSEGIGLGMATAKRIVEEHDGEIEIENRQGRGTRVRILLPAASVEEASEMALPTANGASR